MVESVFQGNPNLRGSGKAHNFSHGLLNKGGQHKAKETFVIFFQATYLGFGVLEFSGVKQGGISMVPST